MQAILKNVQDLLPFFLGSWGLFLLFTFLRPQRFTNSLFADGGIAGDAFFLFPDCSVIGVVTH